MVKRTLEEEIEKKRAEGKDRIVVSISFKFTDRYELGLLEHIWRYSKSNFLKLLVSRDKEGIAASPNIVVECQVEEEEEDVSSFL
ncbi:hypothetical protein [Niallia sp. NCCP-28]|uniref:hypothetical protein n=1 Tax=Niallia sp. NCCP-28 TaxID=2934712 RepID=UPI00208B312B|nr:hypothetical protein [Niallia sp. NCCP-28]GKU82584.1 hypothetical protein NCCP28_19800 [Niallia sp. NCCP-28]